MGALALGLGGRDHLPGRPARSTAEHPDRLLGDAIFLGAAFCWAIYTLMGRRLMGMADPFRVSTWAMTFGGLFLLVWAAPELATTDWTGLPPDFWLEIGYLALMPTAIGYALYYRGVRDVGPTTASSVMFLVPFSGATMAVILLGQSLQGGPVPGCAHDGRRGAAGRAVHAVAAPHGGRRALIPAALVEGATTAPSVTTVERMQRAWIGLASLVLCGALGGAGAVMALA